jgi:prepilin-type N-terminal cleavage/methylation domain-containing protein
MKLRTYRGRSTGFTLVEVMLVIATIALLASVAVPSIFRARKRSQATRILEDLRMVDSAMQLYAMEFNCSGHETFTAGDAPKLKKYIKTDSALFSSLPNDMLGNSFTFLALDTHPKVNPLTYENFSDVAPMDFWSPYSP